MPALRDNYRMGKNKTLKKSGKISYYHGGFPGLVPGDEILASEKTSISLRGGYTFFDPKLIFITTSLNLATGYALQFARKASTSLPNYSGPAKGSVYEIRLKGQKEPDEDFVELALSRGGQFSFSVLTPPVITKVVEGPIKANPTREYKLLAPFQTWSSPDETVYPMWTSSGYMMPNANDTAKGITWEDIERAHQMGPFPGQDELIERGFYEQ